MTLRWSKRSFGDLQRIGRHIGKDKPDAARKHVALLKERAKRAAEHPYSGRVVPEWGQSDVREIITGSYRIIYHISAEDLVEVLAVLEGHRLLRLVPPAAGKG